MNVISYLVVLEPELHVVPETLEVDGPGILQDVAADEERGWASDEGGKVDEGRAVGGVAGQAQDLGAEVLHVLGGLCVQGKIPCYIWVQGYLLQSNIINTNLISVL